MPSEASTSAPAPAAEKIAVDTAAMPDANTSPDSAPSSSATARANASVVGLPCRE